MCEAAAIKCRKLSNERLTRNEPCASRNHDISKIRHQQGFCKLRDRFLHSLQFAQRKFISAQTHAAVIGGCCSKLAIFRCDDTIEGTCASKISTAEGNRLNRIPEGTIGAEKASESFGAL